MFFRINVYADKLLEDLDKLQKWPEKVLTMQRNWIGRSEGVEVSFRLADSEDVLNCFTTRIDTIYGATFIAIAADHPLALDLIKRGWREQRGEELHREGEAYFVLQERRERRRTRRRASSPDVTR